MSGEHSESRPSSHCLSVLVAGLGKSGTTGMFYDLAASSRFDRTVFEPKSIPSVKLAEEGYILVKSLNVLGAIRHARSFDRAILMIRNPIDRLISILMFAPGGPRNFSDNQNVELYLRTLKQVRLKQRSFRDLLDTFEGISGQNPTNDDLTSLVRAHRSGRLFSMKYEDYVDGHHAPLNDYLGFTLERGAASGSHSRVVRTKSHGEWKCWLADSDVEYLNEVYADFNNAFGYSFDVSDLVEDAASAELSEEYTLRLINGYREKFRLPRVEEPYFGGGPHFDSAVSAMRSGEIERALEEVERALAVDSKPVGYHRLRRRLEKRLSAS